MQPNRNSYVSGCSWPQRDAISGPRPPNCLDLRSHPCCAVLALFVLLCRTQPLMLSTPLPWPDAGCSTGLPLLSRTRLDGPLIFINIYSVLGVCFRTAKCCSTFFPFIQHFIFEILCITGNCRIIAEFPCAAPHPASPMIIS